MSMQRILFLFLLILPPSLKAQQIIFCESVDKSGFPINASREFTIGNKGGFIKILVKLDKEVKTENVIFDIYKMNDDKKIYNNTLHMTTKPGLTWFYKEITFFNSGDYQVYVYDEFDKILGVGEVKIILR
jgi:hypothetical protein